MMQVGSPIHSAGQIIDNNNKVTDEQRKTLMSVVLFFLSEKQSSIASSKEPLTLSLKFTCPRHGWWPWSPGPAS